MTENQTVTAEPIQRWTTPPSYETLREEKVRLENQVAVLTRSTENLLGQVRNGQRAVELIGERLMQEADKRGWCSEYDSFVDDINGELPHGFELPVREREYEVRWTQTVTVNVDMTATFTASDEDEAISMARDWCDGIDTSAIVQSVRDGNWEEDYDGASDFEVTEL